MKAPERKTVCHRRFTIFPRLQMFMPTSGGYLLTGIYVGVTSGASSSSTTTTTTRPVGQPDSDSHSQTGATAADTGNS